MKKNPTDENTESSQVLKEACISESPHLCHLALHLSYMQNQNLLFSIFLSFYIEKCYMVSNLCAISFFQSNTCILHLSDSLYLNPDLRWFYLSWYLWNSLNPLLSSITEWCKYELGFKLHPGIWRYLDDWESCGFKFIFLTNPARILLFSSSPISWSQDSYLVCYQFMIL